MVNEITEIENDESPNRKTNRFDYQNSMGFKPEEGSHRNFTIDVEPSSALKEPNNSKGFEQEVALLPLNITYNKTDKVFGVSSNMHQKETQYNSF